MTSLFTNPNHLTLAQSLNVKARSHYNVTVTENSKDHNKSTAVTTKPQRIAMLHNALICFIEHTVKGTENDASSAMLRSSVNKP